MNANRWRIALQSFLFLLLATTLTSLWFAPVVLVDAGFLNHRINDILRSYGDHLIPTTYLLFWAFGYAFETNWYPYGATLLVAHALLCWSIAHIVLVVGRSFVCALFILLLLSTCIPLAAGPTFSFTNICSYAVLLLCVGVVYVLWLRDGSRRRWHLPALGAIVTTGAFTVGTGLFLFVVVASFLIFLTAHKILFGVGPLRGGRPLMSAIDWSVVGVLVTSVIIYGLACAYGVVFLSNPLPGTISVSQGVPPRPSTLPARAINLLEYSHSGLFFPNFSEDYRDDYVVVPFLHDTVIRNTTPLLLIVCFLILLPTALIIATRASDNEDRRLAFMVVASAATSAMIAFLTVAGRPIVPYWVTRYAICSFVFASLAIGLSLAIWFRLLERPAPGKGRRRRLVQHAARIVLLGVGLLLAWGNVAALRPRLAEFSQIRSSIRERPTVDWQATWYRKLGLPSSASSAVFPMWGCRNEA
jgi:hypothetical protein